MMKVVAIFAVWITIALGQDNLPPPQVDPPPAVEQPVAMPAVISEPPTDKGEEKDEVYNATYWFSMSRQLRRGQDFKYSVEILKGTDPVSVMVNTYDYNGKNLIDSLNPTTVTDRSTDPVSVMVNIYDYNGKNLIDSLNPTTVTDRNTVVTISTYIPHNFTRPGKDSWNRNYVVEVIGKGNTVNFAHNRTVTLQDKSLSIFVQTDKAVFKPGQKVNFRILAVEPDMAVIRNSPISVVMRDSKGNLMMQYDPQVPSANGVLQLGYQLADTVFTGDWEIEVSVMEEKEKINFKVQDYTLPKFEVTVTLPPYGLNSETILPVTVEAEYTFGQPIREGSTCVISVGFKQRYYAKYRRLFYKGRLDADGKFTLNIPTNDLRSYFRRVQNYYNDNRGLSYSTFEVLADVTEADTGSTFNGTASITYHYRSVVMRFLDISPNSYKPGLSYTGYLEVTKPEGIRFTANETRGIVVNFNVTYEVPLTKDEIEEAERQRRERLNLTTTTRTPPTPKEVSSSNSSSSGSSSPSEPVAITADIDYVGRPYYYQPRTKTIVLPLTEPNVTLPANGWIPLTFDLPKEAQSAQILATLVEPKVKDVNAYKSLSKAESPSDSYLQLSVGLEKPKVGEPFEVKVRSTDPMRKVYYQIYSKGVLEGRGQVDRTPGVRELSIKFQVTNSMNLGLSVVVYYIREENKEFVVDAISLSVDGVFPYPVKVSFDKEVVKPGENVTLTVEAPDASTVFLRLVDRSVKLLGDKDITQEVVVNELAEYQYGRYYGPWRYMFLCGWPSFFWGPDAATTFSSANVIMLSDANIYRKNQGPVFGDRVYFSTMADAGGAAGPVPRNTIAESSQDVEPADVVRRDFPESWLWTMSLIPSGNTVSMELTAPDTITTWEATVFSTHPNMGLSVGEEAAEVTTFRQMFVSLDLPLTIVRGEDYCFTATVFSYYAGEMPVLLTLHKNDAFEVLHVSLEGQQVNITREKLYYSYFLGDVREREAPSAKFCITPLVIGDFDVQVSALTSSSIGLSDSVIRTITSKPEGTPRSTTTSFLLDQTTGLFEQVVPIEYPAEAVEGSKGITVTVSGNILGPFLANINDILKKPYGCGEQNMINFAPSVFIAEYFLVSGTITEELLKTSKEYMGIGYQKENQYEHLAPWYGFSAFGNQNNTKENPSIWLTAFVLKCYSQAAMLDRQYSAEYGKIITIDPDILARSAALLVRHQREDGSFEEIGRVVSKSLQGGSAEGEALTAYIADALYEVAQVLDPAVDAEYSSELYQQITDALNKAVAFLERRVENPIADPYDACLLSYTLHRVNSPMRDDALKWMEARATEDGNLKYWERSRPINQNRYYWYSDTDPISIEATSYCLMVYALRDEVVSEGIPVVRWLAKHRGRNGGFISTQDTVVGLQALTSVASKLIVTEDIPITVEISYIEQAGLVYQVPTLTLNRSNEYVFNSYDIKYTAADGVSSSVQIRAQTSSGQVGSSAAVAEVTLTYNVLQDTATDVYDLQHKVEIEETYFTLIVDIRSKTAEPRGMSLLECDIASGLTPDISRIERNEDVSQVEINGDILVVYFQTDTITMDGVNLEIVMSQNPNSRVTRSKPRTCSISDYYDPDLEQSVVYVFDQGHPLCRVVRDFGRCSLLPVVETSRPT